MLSRRHGGIVLFFAAFLGISFLTRVALLLKAAADVTWSPSLLAAFGWGVVYDLGAACFAALPQLLADGLLRAGERVVAVNTGSVEKYLPAVRHLL